MKAKQNSAVHNFLTKFATIFTPLIPGFIAAGLLLGIATLLKQTLVVDGVAPVAWLTQLIAYMKVFSIGLFAFLSILIGFNTQKAFGGTGINGAIITSLFILRYVPEAPSAITRVWITSLGWSSICVGISSGYYWPVPDCRGLWYSSGICTGLLWFFGSKNVDLS